MEKHMKNGKFVRVLSCSLALSFTVFAGISAPQSSTATEAVSADGDRESGELRVPLAPAFSAQQLTALPEQNWV
ncbi:uncharacterized protein METZ01_LOCUS477858, partial [marine metagenome]